MPIVLMPFSCCNMDPANMDARYRCKIFYGDGVPRFYSLKEAGFSEDTCEISMEKMMKDIIGLVESYIFIFVLTELFASAFYILLYRSTTDEYQNKQRPSIVRFPWSIFVPSLVLLVLVYMFVITIYEMPYGRELASLFGTSTNSTESEAV